MKQFIVFDKVLYTAALDTRLYRYCLLRQPALIKFAFLRLLYGFLHGIGSTSDEIYYSKRWLFLRSLKNPERRIKKFWQGRFRGRLAFRPEWSRTLWLSLMPEQVLKPCAVRHGAVISANTYDYNTGKFHSFGDYNELYREGVKLARPSDLIDGLSYSVQGSVKTSHSYNGKVFSDLSSAKRYKLQQTIGTFTLLTALGIILGILSLYFAPQAEFRRQDFFKFFNYPELVFLNVLPVIVIIILFYYLTNRVAVAFAISSVIVLVPTFINYYKLLVRNDPLYLGDIAFFRETQMFASKYGVSLNKAVVVAVALCIVITILCALIFQRHKITRGTSRAAGLVVSICAVIGIANLYVNDNVYANTSRPDQNNQWNETLQYTSRGFIYPFLYNIKNNDVSQPIDYEEEEAINELTDIPSFDIPELKKVNIVSIMCESFNDLSKFETINFTRDIYKPLHDLQKESWYGELCTNIFAGGTVDTEWAFLTGNSEPEKGIRGNVNSYVHYLRSQGYFAEGSHPGDDWFYDRVNVNDYLGFNQYWYYQNYYDQFAYNGFAKDNELFTEIIKKYETHVDSSNEPYFSFNVTYQNHGPYSSSEIKFDKEYVAIDNMADSSYLIINNYMQGIANTVENIIDMADYFEKRSEPVLMIVFGDHNPWLGNSNEVYRELGISFDGDEGFEAYYSVPYIVYANAAAKEALDSEFVGEGPLMSPCFLMGAVFEQAGMGGDSYMNAANEIMKYSPVISHTGVRQILGTWGIYKDQRIDEFLKLQYYRRHNYSQQS